MKDQINEKCSFFGSQAIKNITDFFKGDQFQNDPTKIAKYAMWALRTDGPAVWEIPTPIDCLFPNMLSCYIVHIHPYIYTLAHPVSILETAKHISIGLHHILAVSIYEIMPRLALRFQPSSGGSWHGCSCG